jgi:hypothetical protein
MATIAQNQDIARRLQKVAQLLEDQGANRFRGRAFAERQAQFPSEGGSLWGLIPGVGWSDHWAFWKEGFPAVMVTDTALFRYPAYHSNADRPEFVQYERMARVVSGLHAVIAEMVNTPK